MTEFIDNLQRFRGIAFVGNYLPRQCGIATFTHDLAEAVANQAEHNQPVIVCAMNDIPEGYNYPDRVKFEVRQDYPVDYSKAADFLNLSPVDVISLQHEFGIFGGEAGSNILTLLQDLRRPVVVTCHTILQKPKPENREVLLEIAARARKLVVMSKRASAILQTVYGLDPQDIVHIPHGVHDVPFVDPSYYKDKFALEGRRVILTFGLLSPSKGIQYMIQAMPRIVERHPNATYVVLGATHPKRLRKEGEAYRLGLQMQIRELGLEKHVMFHPRFVELEELLEYIGASDIFVTPYLNRERVTSGVLSYAMGMGKAVVSTDYWHAQELLSDGRGRLVEEEDADALAAEINELLGDEISLGAMRKRAYLHCRGMIWPSVARKYLDLFDEVRSRAARSVSVPPTLARPISAASLPMPKLDHLVRLTDDTGIAHYALRALPDWSHGYRLADAALGLIATVKHYEIFGDKTASVLAQRYLILIQYLVGQSGHSSAHMDYGRHKGGEVSQKTFGKTAWALGYTVSRGADLLSTSANDIFHRIVPDTKLQDPQGAALAVLGAASYLDRFPGASAVRRYLVEHTDLLFEHCRASDWIDRWGDADWGVAAQALAIAGNTLDREVLRARSTEMVSDLIALTQGGTVFLRSETNPDEEELPVSAMSFIEALSAVFTRDRDQSLLEPIRAAVDWFLGANLRSQALYDFKSGGCHDALTASGLNLNQGAQATLACLIAFLTLHELATLSLQEQES